MPSLTNFFLHFSRRRRDASRDRGAISPIAALALLPIIAVTAVMVDGGRVWVDRQRVQTAAEASAMSAGANWSSTGTACDAASTDLVGSNAGSTTTYACTTTGTRTSGVVTVTARKNVSAMFGSIIGRSSTEVSSTASVKVAALSSAAEVRPTAICAGNPALVEWEHSGFSGTKTYTMGIQQDDDDDGYDGVCGHVPGNWAVLDFDGGANRNVDTQDWIDHGYEHEVEVDHDFSGDPGIPSPSLNMNQLTGKTVIMPVYDRATGTGATASYHISGFVGVTVVSSNLGGAASQRNMKVKFTPVQVSGAGCSRPASNYGAVTWKPCSLDGNGVCS